MDFKKGHIQSGINKIYNNILDLIFPIECLGCGEENIWLCKKCFRNIKLNSNQYCLHCKTPNELGEFCKNCSLNYALDGVWIAGDYENKVLANLIKNLKYRFAKNIADNLGNLLSQFLLNLINKNRLKSTDIKNGLSWRKFEEITNTPEIFFNLKDALLIPVPLHKKRQRWRGFNQAQTIAEVLAKNFHITINNDLKRIKHKKPQAKLGEADRKSNIINCYEWQGENLKSKNIILIDDVTTTGSTLNECAKVLKNAGANEIWGLVLAKG